jgi:hypothetical protein
MSPDAKREKDVTAPDIDFSPVQWGGTTYCSACGETNPDEDGECTADAYRDASYELNIKCPVPPEHYGEHTLVNQCGENEPEPDEFAPHNARDGGPKFDGYRGDNAEPLTGEFELIGRAKVVDLIRDELEENDGRSDLEIAGAGLFGHSFDPKEWVNVVHEIRTGTEPVTDTTESFDGEPPPEWVAVEVHVLTGQMSP